MSTIETEDVKTQTKTEQAVAEIAERIQEDPGLVRVRVQSWAEQLQKGVIVTLSISGYAGRAQMTLEDLGIRPATYQEREAYERAIALGHRRLLPKEVLNMISQRSGRIRAHLRMYSFQTGYGRWVHQDRYRAWKSGHERLCQEYLGIADEIVREYPKMLKAVESDYRILGRDAYRRLKETVVPTLDEQRWVDLFISNLMRSMPSPAWIQSRFAVNVKVEYLPELAVTTADRLEAERLRIEARAKAEIQAYEQIEQEVMLARLKEAGQGITDLTDALEAQIREQVYDTILDVLESLRSDQSRLTRGSTMQLKNTIESVTRLMFWEDGDLTERLDALKALIETPPKQRPMDEVHDALVELGAEARSKLLSLGRSPRRSGHGLGIPDDTRAIMKRALRSQTTRRPEPAPLSLAEVVIDDLIARARRPVVPTT